ncbi:hypothetical protein HOO54_17305 [Bacillus sp. WMMC1349]|uniref:hypothetical protein n=1 Tax=Bacillus sp. WMMC1349 TaxID=2736254 RepID=UPI0015570E0C|nr:hypothetical protein [Bacillus sp. WMMC1349]NPC93923.1 hypothetical protein [Bacillus sp. WMMC1349]
MELSYYFYTQLKNREDIDALLLGLMKEIIDGENELNIWRREESEEGEGDTLEFSCESFSVSTNLHFVKDISKEYHMKVNFCLWIYINNGGKVKFMEFIGKLLSATKGGAILIEENESIVLERRKGTLIINNYFFDGDFRDLGIVHLNGIYKKFYLDINVNCHIEDLKFKVTDIVEKCIGEQSVTLVDDEDTPYSFEISSDYFKVFIQMSKRSEGNVCQVMHLGIGVIYPDNDYVRLTIMMNLIKKILKDFKGNCQLKISKGYLIKDCQEYVLMERKENTIIVNENADEKTLFYDIGIPYIERTIEVE